MIGVRFERVYLNEKCRTLWICLLFSLLWTHTSTLHGQARCSQIYSGRVSYDFYGRQGAFVVPNEYNLGEAGSLFSKAPEGVVVSVGTERAFQALGMSAKATHLLAVDLDPAVWVYNRINLELIRHSEGSLEKYETLRGAQSWTELVQMIGGAQKIFDKGRVHQGNWKMWMEAQQMRSMQKLLERGDHYTKNQDQFFHIFQLAVAGRIQIRLGDISNIPMMRSWIDQLGKLAVLDMSNAWWEPSGYIQYNKTHQLISELFEVASPQAIVVMASRSVGARRDEWIYAGFPMAQVKSSTSSYTQFKLNELYEKAQTLARPNDLNDW